MGKWNELIFGDAALLWKWHESEPWKSLFLFVKFSESLFRGFAQVCFANNPWSGLLILIGFTISDRHIALGAILASMAAILTSKIFGQLDDIVVAGLQNYSAVLVGTVTVSLFPLFFHGDVTLVVWISIFITGSLSVIVGMGLSVLLAECKLPFFTLPFNVTISLLFLAFHAAGLTARNSFQIDLAKDNATDSIAWSEIFTGVLKSAGQVYAIDDLPASILILIGLLINSPILTIASFAGGLISSLTALLLTESPHATVAAGIWGYNGFLSFGCCAFFIKPCFLSFLLGALNAFFTTFMQAALIPVFEMNNLPVFTFPFCISSLLFLAMVEKVPALDRIQNLSYPEKHLKFDDVCIRKSHSETTAQNLSKSELTPAC